MKKDTIPDLLAIAFWNALLVSGSVTTAELAVLDGVDTCDDLSHPGFLIETVRSAIRRRRELAGRVDGLELLAPELRSVVALRPLLRDCFVLRVLVGLCPEVCVELLGLSIAEFEDAVCDALRELPLLDAALNRSDTGPHLPQLPAR
jgi:hypothetical protein